MFEEGVLGEGGEEVGVGFGGVGEDAAVQELLDDDATEAEYLC